MVGSYGDGDAGDSIEKIIYLHLKPFRGNNNIMNLIIHMIYIYIYNFLLINIIIIIIIYYYYYYISNNTMYFTKNGMSTK